MLDAAPIWPVDHSLTNFMPVPPGVAPSLDFETRSVCDLKSAGADRYAQDVSTEVLCAAIKVGPAEEIWVPGMPFPRLLQETAIDQGLPIRAWNAAFEIAIWMHVMETDHGWPAMPPERFACTMQRAALVGCPGALDRAVTALALDVSKDMDGHKLMLKMCKPRNVRKGETPPPPGQHLWHEDPDDMLALQRYCMDDTRAEAKALESLPEPNPLETEIIRVDRQINRRGLLVDTHAARGAMAISEVEKKRINEHVKRLTNGEISTTNQVAKILAFVQARGVNIDTLRAQDVRGALMDADEQSEATSGDLDLSTEQIVAYGDMDPTAKELLSARAEMAKASTAKFRALTRSVSFDGRLRDLFAYSAAYRTQRWAGRKFQMHNLPRLNPPYIEEDEPIDPAQEDRWFETLAAGRYDDFAALLPADWSVMDGLKASLRGTVMAEHAHRITVADLAQIEARSLPWMAGQHDVIAAFERLDAAVARDAPKDEIKKLDIYSVTGTKMNSDRQAGKIATLACGYGGGWHTFVLFALGYGLVFSEQQARDIVSSWRAANPMIVEFWTAEEWAAKQAIRNPGIVYSRGHTGAYVFKGGNLLRQLPSGRCLVYRRAGIERMPTPWGQMKDTITYEGNSYAKGQPGVFVRLRTYGGKLAQNANQAICRDILGVGLVRAAHAGLRCVLHVHDEQGVISPIESAAEHGEVLVRAMTDPIRWLPGLPITSSADILRRYAKT